MHTAADAGRAKIFESWQFKIGMTGDISSKIFHAGDERVIVSRQTCNDLRIDAVDAARILKLKDPTVVENFQITAMLVSTQEKRAICFLAPFFLR